MKKNIMTAIGDRLTLWHYTNADGVPRLMLYSSSGALTFAMSLDAESAESLSDFIDVWLREYHAKDAGSAN